MKTLRRVVTLLLALLCLAGCGGNGTRSLTKQVNLAGAAGVEEGTPPPWRDFP